MDRLTIDSSGLASFTGSLTLSSTSSSLTASGNTVLGSTGVQSLTVNAASSFASTAAFTASTALTASGNVQLGASNGQMLTVPATASFSAPVTVASTMRVTGLANFTGGVALTTPVTVNGVPLAPVATTNNYQSLLNRPLFYKGSSTFGTAATGAPDSSVTVGTWYGTVRVTGSAGQARASLTADGTSTGTPLFTSILSVQVLPYQTAANTAVEVAYAAVNGISADRRVVSLVAVTGAGIVLGGNSAAFAADGTLLMCTIFGTL